MEAKVGKDLFENCNNADTVPGILAPVDYSGLSGVTTEIEKIEKRDIVRMTPRAPGSLSEIDSVGKQCFLSECHEEACNTCIGCRSVGCIEHVPPCLICGQDPRCDMCSSTVDHLCAGPHAKTTCIVIDADTNDSTLLESGESVDPHLAATQPMGTFFHANDKTVINTAEHLDPHATTLEERAHAEAQPQKRDAVGTPESMGSKLHTQKKTRLQEGHGSDVDLEPPAEVFAQPAMHVERSSASADKHLTGKVLGFKASSAGKGKRWSVAPTARSGAKNRLPFGKRRPKLGAGLGFDVRSTELLDQFKQAGRDMLEEYTGMISSSINQFGTQLSTLTSEMQSLVTKLEGRVSDLEGRFDDLSKSVTEQNSTVEDKLAHLERLMNLETERRLALSAEIAQLKESNSSSNIVPSSSSVGARPSQQELKPRSLRTEAVFGGFPEHLGRATIMQIMKTIIPSELSCRVPREFGGCSYVDFGSPEALQSYLKNWRDCTNSEGLRSVECEMPVPYAAGVTGPAAPQKKTYLLWANVVRSLAERHRGKCLWRAKTALKAHMDEKGIATHSVVLCWSSGQVYAVAEPDAASPVGRYNDIPGVMMWNEASLDSIGLHGCVDSLQRASFIARTTRTS